MHCRAIAEQHVLHAAPEVEKVQLPNGHEKWQETGERIRAFVSCGNCKQPSMLVLCPVKDLVQPPETLSYHRFTQDPIKQAMFLNRVCPVNDVFVETPDALVPVRPYYAVPAHPPGETLNPFYTVYQQFPESAVQRPDAVHLPEKIDQELNALIQVLHQPRYAIIGCRRVLEMACKEKLGENKKDKNLYELIEAALDELETTKQISEWAHTLRHLGNVAVHKDEEMPDLHEVRQAYDLTRLILDLLFAYPAKIASLRNEA
jgi:hypothetical protein